MNISIDMSKVVKMEEHDTVRIDFYTLKTEIKPFNPMRVTSFKAKNLKKLKAKQKARHESKYDITSFLYANESSRNKAFKALKKKYFLIIKS